MLLRIQIQPNQSYLQIAIWVIHIYVASKDICLPPVTLSLLGLSQLPLVPPFPSFFV